MTNKNITLTSDRNPFLLQPAAKDYLWGGNRLNTEFGKGIDVYPLAETWECSTHPDGSSIVGTGIYKGMPLKEVLKARPDFLGSHPRTTGELPILIKLIDAKSNLSVQVHPDDDYARQYENGQLGKTEMWYVLDADKYASLVYGFKQDISKERLRSSIENGTVEQYMNKVSIKPDDVYFVQSGTVHAIGAGALIAEIQQSSNLTYRLYDYNRIDRNGNKRSLHIDKALDVANLHAVTSPRQPMRTLRYQNGWATEMLCRCKYFQVERVLLNTEQCRKMVSVKTGSNSFGVFLCTKGCGVMQIPGCESIYFFKGDCMFLPADCAEVKIHGFAQLLKVSC